MMSINYDNDYEYMHPNYKQNMNPHKVNFINSIKLFFKNYFNFTGKSSRKEFFYVKLWELLLYIVLTLIFMPLFILNEISLSSSVGYKAMILGTKELMQRSGLFSFLLIILCVLLVCRCSSIGILILWYCKFPGIIVTLIMLVTCIPLLALRVRRFNDIGIPFWNAIMINIARIIFFLLPLPIVGIIPFYALVVLSLIFELMPSEKMNNKISY